jgi:hypothetical protein
MLSLGIKMENCLNNLFRRYFGMLAFPFETHDRLRYLHENGPTGPIHTQSDDSSFDFIEGLAVSWIWAMFRAFYSLAAIYLSFYWVDSLSSPASNNFGLTVWSTQVQKITIFFILIDVIIFPFTQFFYIKFWGLIVKFFQQLYDLDKVGEERVKEVVTQSMAANFYLVIPIFGHLLRYAASFFYLYAGLKSNLKMSTIQASTVLSAPLFIFMFIVFMMMLYFVLIFSML